MGLYELPNWFPIATTKGYFDDWFGVVDGFGLSGGGIERTLIWGKHRQSMVAFILLKGIIVVNNLKEIFTGVSIKFEIGREGITQILIYLFFILFNILMDNII